jgi:hypothetical protein
MFDLPGFSALLGSIAGLIKISKETKDFEITNGLIDLQQKILSLQESFVALREETEQLKAQLKDCQDLGEIQVEYEGNALWRYLQRVTEDPSDGNWEIGAVVYHRSPDPYCPVCWESARKLIHLIRSNEDQATTDALKFYCLNHGQSTFFHIPRRLLDEA